MRLSPEPMRRLAAFVLLVAVLTFALRGADIPAAPAASTGHDEVIALNQITVSAATRTEKLASALPVTTTVVTAGQLEPVQVGATSAPSNRQHSIVPEL